MSVEVGLLEGGWFHPTAQLDLIGDAEGFGGGADLLGLRSVAAEDVAGVWELEKHLLEGFEGGEDAFFGDETAGLDELPSAICGCLALDIGQVLEGNGGGVQAEFFGRTAEFLQAVEQGMAATEDKEGGLENLLELIEVTGLVEEFGGVHSMKGHDPWAAPIFEHAEEADGFVAVVDVNEVGGIRAEAFWHVIGVAGADVFVDTDGWWPLPNHVFEPETEKEIALGAVVKLGHFGDGFEGEKGAVFDLLGIDDGADAGKAADLPIEALHFWLQIGATNTDHEGARIGWG